MSILLAERSQRENFSRALRGVARALWNGDVSKMLFGEAFQLALSDYLTKAFYQGAKDMGIDSDEVTPNEYLQCRLRIIEQLARVPSLADFIAQNSRANGGKLHTIYFRLAAWINQYNAVRNFARVLVGKDAKLQWVMGPVTSEHCPSCLKLSGRVYRASVWRAAQVWPQHRNLKCGGFRCACSLVRTSAKCTRGKVPSIP